MSRRSAMPRQLDRESALPLWTQLTDELLRRLEAGGFDERFPSELELAEQYDLSRHTIRHALSRLREAGLLDTARGRGTRVRTERIEQPLGALYSLFREVEARGMEQRSKVRVLDIRTDAVAAHRLGLSEDADLVYLERLRLAEGEPLALDHVWLSYAVGRHILEADFSHSGLYDNLVARAKIQLTGGAERLSAVVPSAAQRRLLGIGADIAVFEVERTAHDRKRTVEWRLSLIRGDRFSVAADWSRRDGYRLDLEGTLFG